MKSLTESEFEFIISRLVERANESYAESDQDRADAFKQGRRLAYYEMLDILRSELDAHDADLEQFGLSEEIRI